MLVTNKKPQEYKEHTISFTVFYSVENVSIVYFLENMNIHVSGIEKSYKYAIIGHLVHLGTDNLLLHIVQCWRGCAVDEEKKVSTYGSVLFRHYVYILFSSWFFLN